MGWGRWARTLRSLLDASHQEEGAPSGGHSSGTNINRAVRINRAIAYNDTGRRGRGRVTTASAAQDAPVTQTGPGPTGPETPDPEMPNEPDGP